MFTRYKKIIALLFIIIYLMILCIGCTLNNNTIEKKIYNLDRLEGKSLSYSKVLKSIIPEIYKKLTDEEKQLCEIYKYDWNRNEVKNLLNNYKKNKKSFNENVILTISLTTEDEPINNKYLGDIDGKIDYVFCRDENTLKLFSYNYDDKKGFIKIYQSENEFNYYIPTYSKIFNINDKVVNSWSTGNIHHYQWNKDNNYFHMKIIANISEENINKIIRRVMLYW